jgi:uncharacterized protein
MLIYLLHTLWVAALVYAGVCLLYYILQEKFIFVPTLPGEPFEVRLSGETEEFLLETPNEGRIHALLLKVAQPKGVILYLHGNTGSLKRWQFMAEEITTFGYHVFIPDYRGFGKSTGPRSEAILHRDFEKCYDWLREKMPNLPIVVYGRSLGSGFATRLASRREAQKLVLETPYFNLVDVAQFYVPFLPVKWLLRYQLRSDLYIQHVHCPIHIFHGTRDLIVPYESAFKLFRLVEHQKEVAMTTIPGGKHSNLNRFPLFHERLRQFLKEA